MPREIQFMDLAKKCEPEVQAKLPEMTEEETESRITGTRSMLTVFKANAKGVKEEIREKQLYLMELEETVADLQETLLQLQASIHPVTVVTPKTRTPTPTIKTEREQLLDILLSLSPEELAEFEASQKEPS